MGTFTSSSVEISQKSLRCPQLVKHEPSQRRRCKSRWLGAHATSVICTSILRSFCRESRSPERFRNPLYGYRTVGSNPTLSANKSRITMDYMVDLLAIRQFYIQWPPNSRKKHLLKQLGRVPSPTSRSRCVGTARRMRRRCRDAKSGVLDRPAFYFLESAEPLRDMETGWIKLLGLHGVDERP